jgi:hypothetical protein
MFMLHLDAPLVNIPNGAGGLVVLYVVDDMFFFLAFPAFCSRGVVDFTVAASELFPGFPRNEDNTQKEGVVGSHPEIGPI